MTIDKDGFCIDSLDNIMNLMEEQLQSKFGNDFAIKAEGVIDNIALSSCYMNRAIQEQIAYLLKQFDPETAEGKWQDALYERIGIYRLQPQKTTFNCKIQGTPSLVCPAGTITIRSKTDNNEFENVSEVTIREAGSAIVAFQCVAEGPVEVNDTDEFTIVTAPTGITSVVCAEDIKLSIGRDEESDNEFRIRFRNSKALNAKATHNACLANLPESIL